MSEGGGTIRIYDQVQMIVSNHQLSKINLRNYLWIFAIPAASLLIFIIIFIIIIVRRVSKKMAHEKLLKSTYTEQTIRAVSITTATVNIPTRGKGYQRNIPQPIVVCATSPDAATLRPERQSSSNSSDCSLEDAGQMV